MAVRKGEAAGHAALARRSSIKRANSLERLLDSCKAAWPVKTRSYRHVQHSNPVAGKAPAPSKEKAVSQLSAHKFAAGVTLFGAIAFFAGACPSALPWLFLIFAGIGLPYRTYSFLFTQPGNRFFLLDFCYFVSLATAAYLLLPASWLHYLNQRGLPVGAAIYALADGPVAGALVVWQCAWVFPSLDHTLSVMLHLLPGLAMYALHHHPAQSSGSVTPHGALASPGWLAGWQPGVALGSVGLQGWWPAALWLLLVPLAFYMAWQFVYWLVVQVMCGGLIKRCNLDTSYKCLARRARRANNIWSRLVLRGSRARRLFWYGLLQFAFTAITLLVFVPTYYSAHLALAWQVCKFVFPLYHGAVYTCNRLLKAPPSDSPKRHDLLVDARASATGAGRVDARGGTAGAGRVCRLCKK